jgi:thiol-disulfide isomerase/thioredoxin
MLITRRSLGIAAAAAGGTLAAGLTPRKLLAAELHALAAALQVVNPPVAAPDVGFVDAGGKRHSLAEFRGHGMVLNLWATWCPPCVEEMPSLAALSKALAPDDIAVLPLSSDLGGARAVEAFFSQHAITDLPVLLDPSGDAARAFGVRGLPTSVVIDKQGQECARLEGAADWSSPAAVAMVRRLASG